VVVLFLIAAVSLFLHFVDMGLSRLMQTLRIGF
jgi:hypothetical protein